MNCPSFTGNPRIGVVGLGYVGLPLACLFARHYGNVVGFDLNRQRIEEISSGHDHTNEMDEPDLREALAAGLKPTSDPAKLQECDYIIVAVPTPVDDAMLPDLTPLESASRTVGQNLRRGAIVVYESTVSPGITESVCVPEIERASGMKVNEDFFVGYSPERINPGDRVHTLHTVTKIVSGCTPEVGNCVEALYSAPLNGHVYRAPSIAVAEAAKILENTQRDVNIALINEVTRLFNTMGVDVEEVVKAAATKWNFTAYHPGLVGGHCIGVDPYYLVEAARKLGVETPVISSARKVNEGMAPYLAQKALEAVKKQGKNPAEASVLLMGFAFKPDCPDTRNTKVYNVYRSLLADTPTVTVFDPVVSPHDVQRSFNGLTVVGDFDSLRALGPFDVVVWCTPHSIFADIPLDIVCQPEAPHVRLVDDFAGAPVQKGKPELSWRCGR